VYWLKSLRKVMRKPCLDDLGEQPAGAVPEDLGEDVLAGGQRHDADVGGRLVHGGALLGLVGKSVCS
jgi:hypothetical protein